ANVELVCVGGDRENEVGCRRVKVLGRDPRSRSFARGLRPLPFSSAARLRSTRTDSLVDLDRPLVFSGYPVRHPKPAVFLKQRGGEVSVRPMEANNTSTEWASVQSDGAVDHPPLVSGTPTDSDNQD